MVVLPGWIIAAMIVADPAAAATTRFSPGEEAV
jgi:hypothetical protein